MSIESMSVIEQATAMRDGLAPGKIRALIAKHLGVEIERVTDEAHFANDLGADWLDRVELVIASGRWPPIVEALRRSTSSSGRGPEPSGTRRSTRAPRPSSSRRVSVCPQRV